MAKKETKGLMTRRDFIKGAAVGGGALLLGSAVANEAKAISLTPVPRKWTHQTGMLIVGAGGAGLMAAIEAYDQGAKVLIVEMQESPYTSESALCGGIAGIPRNQLQLEEGITDDSPDQLFQDMMKVGRYSNRQELLHLYTDNVTEAYQRWTEHGAKPISHRYVGGHSKKRVLGYVNRKFTDALYGQVKKRNIPILFNTRANSLIIDPKTGRVLGIEARQGVKAPFFNYEEGKKIWVKGKVTVLCTGGMCGSPEMLNRYVPRVGKIALAAWATPGDPGILSFPPGTGPARPIGLGDGYIMGMEIGADTTHMYSITTYTGIPHPENPKYSNWFSRPPFPWYSQGALAVNKDGKRFIEDATAAPCDVGEAMLMQPEKTLFNICDGPMWKKFTPNEAQQKLIDSGKAYIWFADTLEDLAAKAKIDPAGLRKTIEDYNRYVEQGSDPEFGRPKQFLVRKIETPPFVAHENWLAPLHNSGGLVANTQLQILDVRGRVIPGLYGAGEIIGGDSGEVYLTCTHWPCAMTYGYLVGKKFAIKEALAK
jgi:succinate dehydrogenase/fumarate reductase flavoprotein subunit